MKLSKMEVHYIDHCGSDLSVVNAARVSFDKESEWEEVECIGKKAVTQVLSERDTKLIHYLAKHKHTSPFNHAFISLRVKAPVFIARQLVKHKFLPWNEVSRRYVDSEPEFWFPEHWRAKAENVKQGSGEAHVEQSPEFLDDHAGAMSPHTVIYDALRVYSQMIQDGYCAEQARMILPQNMMTEWYWSGTLGAYCDMLKLRLDSHAQKETQEVAQMVRNIIEPLFPVSVKELLNA